MKKIIIVRHGDYDDSGNMNPVGAAQMKRVALDLNNGILLGHKVRILSSAAPRAAQCAEILSRDLDIPMETHEILWSDNKHSFDLVKTLNLITEKVKEYSLSIVIIITHLEYCDFLPEYIYRMTTKKSKSFPELQKGQKLIIDFEE